MSDEQSETIEPVKVLIDSYPGVIRVDSTSGMTCNLTMMVPAEEYDSGFAPATSAMLDLDESELTRLRDACDAALRMMAKAREWREREAARRNAIKDRLTPAGWLS